MAAFCPRPVLPSPDACTAAPENENALIPFDQIMMCAGYPDEVFRQRLGSMQTDGSTTAYAGRAVGRTATWGRLPRTYLRFGNDRTIATKLKDRMIAGRRTDASPFLPGP